MARRPLSLALPLIFALVLASIASAAPPAGFTDTLVTNISDPTGLAFASNDRLLVIAQTGQLRVVQGGGQPQLALDLGPSGEDVLCDSSERGLLGVAVDPQFATNHYVYLYYTFKKHPRRGQSLPDSDPGEPRQPGQPRVALCAAG